MASVFARRETQIARRAGAVFDCGLLKKLIDFFDKSFLQHLDFEAFLSFERFRSKDKRC